MEKIKTAIIGCGPRGNVHAKSIVDNNTMDIIYACDLIKERAQQCADKCKTTATLDYHQILADKAIEAVIIATDVNSHLAIAADTIKAGKHIITEKPLGSDIGEARQLIKLAEDKKQVIYVSFQLRFNAKNVAIKSACEKIDPVQISFKTQRGILRPQFLNDSPFCGIMDVVAHDFDLLLWLMNKSPKAVTAVLRRNTFTKDTNTADVLSTLIDFDDGRSAIIFAGVGAEEVGRSVNIIGACGNISQEGFEKVSGVSFDRYNFTFGGSDGRTPLYLEAKETPDLDYALHQAFVEEIRTGKKSQAASLTDGLNSLLLTYACLKSAKENKRVVLSEL